MPAPVYWLALAIHKEEHARPHLRLTGSTASVHRPQHTVDPNYEASDHDQRLSHRGPQFVCDVNLRFVRRVYLERPELLLVRLHDVPLDLV